MLEFLTREFIYKFIKFGIVGASGMVIDFGTTYIFKELVKVQKYIANAIGFTIAATTNYFFNRIWTFHSNNPEIAIEYSKFFFVSLIGLGINTLILWVFVSRYKMNFYLSKLFAICVVILWNFFVNVWFTFR